MSLALNFHPISKTYHILILQYSNLTHDHIISSYKHQTNFKRRDVIKHVNSHFIYLFKRRRDIILREKKREKSKRK